MKEMDIQFQAKRLYKAVRKNEDDASKLKKLLEEGKSTREVEFIIHGMITRSETVWQYLRYLSRTLNENVKDKKRDK